MTDLSKLPEDIHIAVLMGGWANERPVSLMSGEGVAKALEERGHRVTRIDMDRNVAARLQRRAPMSCSMLSTAYPVKMAPCRACSI